MNAYQRVKYFDDIYQAIPSKTSADPTSFHKKLNEDSFSVYKNWTEKNKGTTLQRSYKQGKIRRGKKHREEDKEDLFDLIAFLRHVYVHNAKCVLFEVIDKEIIELCPGFSSRVHEIFHMKSISSLKGITYS